MYLFVKIEQGLSFFFVRPVLLRLRVNRTGASHVAPLLAISRTQDSRGFSVGGCLQRLGAYNDFVGQRSN
jgi:hypothetical protein